jgi:7-carboxy-7-deazaguanine synthase
MTTNTQQPEPPATGEGQTLDVHSIFYTIQGEGPLSGLRATFVRLAGCNLQCPGCDTEYTQGRRPMSVNAIVNEIRNKHDLGKCNPVIITGGEPLRQPIGPLVDILLFTGREVQIESNGVCAPDIKLFNLLWNNHKGLHLVVSPKTKKIHPQCHDLATTFKYVLNAEQVSEEDGLPTIALDHEAGKGVARPRPGAPVYLSPMDDGNDELNRQNRLAVARSCMRYGYRAGLQVHKYLELA